MNLMEIHIKDTHEEAEVAVFENWPKDQMKSNNNRLAELPGFPKFGDKEYFFLFDQGQTSYWDNDLWPFLKDYVQRKVFNLYVVLFCSYENIGPFDPSRMPTPLAFNAEVTLDRTTTRTSKSYGLRLDEEEFRDVLKRQGPKLHVADDLRDFMYNFAQGHVGHTRAFADFLVKQVMNSQCSASLVLTYFIAREIHAGWP